VPTMTSPPRRVQIGAMALDGDLTVPAPARGLVVFAHGSGSTRRSPRNQQVARTLQALGFATLLFDLLTPDEEADRGNVFDIDLLAGRLVEAIDWVGDRPALAPLPLGLFGASTGAAAALRAASLRPGRVRAIVSRGGRPDLAGDALRRVRAPTLLIVGGADTEVLSLNQVAIESLGRKSKLCIVPDATHLFEEEGALERVAELAGRWFAAELPVPGGRPLPA